MKSLDRRSFLVAMPIALAACSAGARKSSASETHARADLPVMTVHKNPSCGCCTAWAEQLQTAGFEVRVVEVEDTGPVAARLGVPDDLRSCHTAEIGGYAIEGHVPASDIRRLLAERPVVAGLAVPGMPAGSPGMEMGDRRDPYQVIRFDRNRIGAVYASY